MSQEEKIEMGRKLTARTLEEIEALAAMRTVGQWAYFRHDCKELAHIESFEVTFGEKYGTAWLQSGGGDHPKDLGKTEAEANAALMANAPRLLAIAQEQRGAMAADEERTRAAAMRVWGEHVRGCDTADAMADLIVSQRAEIARLQDNASTAAFDKVHDQLGEANRENEEQRAEIAAMRKVIDIARVCANEGDYKQCPRTDDHHIALLEMDQAIKNIGTKR